MEPFRPEPLSDFAVDEERREMAHAIASVAEQLDQSYGMVVGGDRIGADATFRSLNPSQPGEVISTFPRGGAEQADRALAAAAAAQDGWAATSVRERASVLRRCAGKLRRRRLELAAWVCFEAGWPWRDADAEVADALDHLEFHAAAGEAAGAAGRLARPGGPAVVLAPRHAPLAGAVAAAGAALVAGHAVVLEPSSVVPTLAWKVVEALLDAGLPAGALNLVTSDDPAFAAALAAHPAAGVVCCGGDPDAAESAGMAAGEGTGRDDRSRFVEPPLPGVAVVAGDTDAGEAARIVVASAFAAAGQRRGACVRAIVAGEAYDAFVDRCAAAAGELLVGPAIDFTTDVGPLADEAAARAVAAAVEETARSARVVAGGSARPGGVEGGCFVAPTVVADVADGAPLTRWGTRGPVLAVTRAVDMDEALRFAAATGDPCAAAVFAGDAERAVAAATRLAAAPLHPRPRIGTDPSRAFWAQAFGLLDRS